MTNEADAEHNTNTNTNEVGENAGEGDDDAVPCPDENCGGELEIVAVTNPPNAASASSSTGPSIVHWRCTVCAKRFDSSVDPATLADLEGPDVPFVAVPPDKYSTGAWLVDDGNE